MIPGLDLPAELCHDNRFFGILCFPLPQIVAEFPDVDLAVVDDGQIDILPTQTPRRSAGEIDRPGVERPDDVAHTVHIVATSRQRDLKAVADSPGKEARMMLVPPDHLTDIGCCKVLIIILSENFGGDSD